MAAAAAAVVLAGAARGGASQRQESEAVPRDQKGTPSRWRFHPPPPLAFRLGLAAFPVRPPEATSTYSRSVLGASGNLRETQEPFKTPAWRICAKSANFSFMTGITATMRARTAWAVP